MTRDIAVLVGVQLLWGFGFGVIAPIWPLALREIGASPQDVGVVFGVGNLAAVFAFLPAGYIADRVGRKPVIVAALAVGAIGAWSFVPLTDWHGAFIGSALFWTATAGLPVLLAYIAATVPRARAGSAMGVVLSAYFAGNILGSPLAGFIAARFDLHATIAVAALFLTLSAALALALRALPPAPEHGAFRPARVFWILLAIAPFGAALSIVSLTLYPVYLHEVAGVLVERVGIFVALVSFGSTVLAIAMGRLADELGTVAALMTAAAALVSGAILTALAGRSEPVIAVGAFLLGATQASSPVLAAAVERIIPPARASLGYATYQVAFAVGFGSGGAVAGVLYEADPLLPFLVTAALALPIAATAGAVLAAMPRVERVA